MMNDGISHTHVMKECATQYEHSEMVKDLCKSGAAMLSTLTPKQIEMLHMAVGVSGETGELLDAIKKHTIYNQKLDIANVIEELGDAEFYLEGLRQVLGIKREDTLKHNLNKLLTGNKARYKSGEYSDEQAHNRADKK